MREGLPGAGAGDGGRIRFWCAGCGEAVRDGEECLILRVGGERSGRPEGRGRAVTVRLCGDCAGERDTLAGHLDLVGARYFSGPAEEAEGWESLGR